MSCNRCIREAPKSIFVAQFRRTSPALARNQHLHPHRQYATDNLLSAASTLPLHADEPPPSSVPTTSSLPYAFNAEILQIIRKREFKISTNTSRMSNLVPFPSTPRLSNLNYWTYTDQRTSNNTSVRVYYCSNHDVANSFVKKVTGKVLGLDLEWNPWGPINVDLVQVCDEHTIVLIHLTPMNSKPSIL